MGGGLVDLDLVLELVSDLVLNLNLVAVLDFMVLDPVADLDSVVLDFVVLDLVSELDFHGSGSSGRSGFPWFWI